MFRFALLISFFALSLQGADPFIGKWKLSLEKSKLTGQTITIEEVPGNSFKFQEDEHSDVIFADGLDHPTHFGETMSIAKKSDLKWAITYKKFGRVTMDTLWQVSPDGQTLVYTASGIRPNGQHFSNRLLAKRKSGGPGLAGVWESKEVALSSPREIYIEPYGKDGQMLTFPGRKEVIKMYFDGKEYRETGPTVKPGATSSGRRIDERNINTTEKINGKIVETARATISADGKTQTLVINEPDDPTPVVLVYERE